MLIRSAPILGILLLLIGHNAYRFATAEPKWASSKHLHYLPEPAVARALSLGHRNSAAKLRWIDSFKYFSYQIEVKDDSLPGDDPRGGFERLYELLIGMDPRCEPFTVHATLTTAGIMDNQYAALRFLVRGVMANPRSAGLWANLASHLHAFYHLEKQHPEQMEAVLQSWAAAVGPAAAAAPQHWLAAMARRQQRGNAQIEYWFARLRESPSGSQSERLVEGILREQIARWHCQLLQATVDHRHSTVLSGLHCDTTRLAPEAQSSYGPITSDGRIRHDPYGGVYILDDSGTVRSQGWEAELLQKRLDQGQHVDEAQAEAFLLQLNAQGDRIVLLQAQDPWQLRDECCESEITVRSRASCGS